MIYTFIRSSFLCIHHTYFENPRAIIDTTTIAVPPPQKFYLIYGNSGKFRFFFDEEGAKKG